MNIVNIAAFSDGRIGGNPAGVAVLDAWPSSEEMQSIAADVGFSETVFAVPQGGDRSWRVRYFSPESEVAFCGHATIALGAELAKVYGEGSHQLVLNDANICVEGKSDNGQYSAALQSPPTHYELLDSSEVHQTLKLFGYDHQQLSEQISPARIHGGADHYVIVLKSRSDLASMTYDLDQGRKFMRERDLVTIMLVVVESSEVFHVRNAFASGGVLEDPATGAAAAAFAGYLRDSKCTQSKRIQIIQGEDMGSRSIIFAESGAEIGSSIRVSGAARSY